MGVASDTSRSLLNSPPSPPTPTPGSQGYAAGNLWDLLVLRCRRRTVEAWLTRPGPLADRRDIATTPLRIARRTEARRAPESFEAGWGHVDDRRALVHGLIDAPGDVVRCLWVPSSPRVGAVVHLHRDNASAGRDAERPVSARGPSAHRSALPPAWSRIPVFTALPSKMVFEVTSGSHVLLLPHARVDDGDRDALPFCSRTAQPVICIRSKEMRGSARLSAGPAPDPARRKPPGEGKAQNQARTAPSRRTNAARANRAKAQARLRWWLGLRQDASRARLATCGLRRQGAGHPSGPAQSQGSGSSGW